MKRRVERVRADRGEDALHPRNPHRGRYDFPRLIAANPALAPFARKNPAGEPTVDFTDPRAVRALNQAILAADYGVAGWELPPGFLCPPIPGRADALHHLADLLSDGSPRRIPRGPGVRILDVGVGAGCIYPILGRCAYGWSFVGTEIDAEALASARRILRANAGLSNAIELRRQPDPAAIFRGVLRDGETFDLSLCNPPFHPSVAEAKDEARRKWRKLGRAGAALNFGGRAAEISCAGGERGFIGRMIAESAGVPTACRWFTTLVSREAHLPQALRALERAGAADVRVQQMGTAQKTTRILAWTFIGNLDAARR